jgi:serine/threonine protein kinase
MMDTAPELIQASADIWSLAMVISEICNGEVPYDTPECRQMTLDAFLAHVRGGARPVLNREFQQFPWLTDMVIALLLPSSPLPSPLCTCTVLLPCVMLLLCALLLMLV